MKQINELKNRINKSNLAKKDKQILIDAIDNDSCDIDSFLKKFLQIMSISKKAFEAFDIDIGEIIKDVLK